MVDSGSVWLVCVRLGDKEGNALWVEGMFLWINKQLMLCMDVSKGDRLRKICCISPN